MKQIFNWRWLNALLIVFTFSTLAISQGPGPRSGENLFEALELTDTQIEQVEKLRADLRTEMQTLRQQERSPELREQMRDLMDQFHADVETLLTTEQKAKWEELQANRKERMGERAEKRQDMRENRKALRDEVKGYRETNILPVLLTQRAKLEVDLSAEDKETLAALRAKLAEAKAQKAERSENKGGKQGLGKTNHGRRGPQGFGQGKPGSGQGMIGRRHGKHAGILSEADRETLKGLVEKYASRIDALQAEIASEKETWKKDLQYIHEKHKPENAKEGKGKGLIKGEISEEKKARMESKHKARFLLLDPEQTIGKVAEKVDRKVNVYPNPSATQQKINFEVLSAGKVTVEIVDAYGNVVKQVFSGNLPTGENTLDISVQDLKGKNYYYRITDGAGTTSKPVVIQ